MPNDTARPDDLTEASELGNDIVPVYLVSLASPTALGILARDPDTDAQVILIDTALPAHRRRAVVADLLDRFAA